MIAKLRRLGVVLALALTAAACQDTGGLLQPSQANRADGTTTTAKKYRIAKSVTLNADKYVEVLVEPAHSSAEKRQGRLGIAGHLLSVPEGAVTKNTLFTMKVSSKDSDGTAKILLELKAYQQDDKGDYKVSVGHLGFAKPLPLRISYDGMVDVVLPTSLRILWVKGTDSYEEFPTTMDLKERWLYTQVDHFSPYGVGWPE